MPRPGSVKTSSWAYEINLYPDVAVMLLVLAVWTVVGGPVPEWLPQIPVGSPTGASGSPVPLLSIRRG
ncbi:hypothetical protein GCM10018779_12700 [Streptomyces griseocarneus]|nr:hypothetical protein GCM10018779_12700 [Streptomyces griseocarneus]